MRRIPRPDQPSKGWPQSPPAAGKPRKRGPHVDTGSFPGGPPPKPPRTHYTPLYDGDTDTPAASLDRIQKTAAAIIEAVTRDDE